MEASPAKRLDPRVVRTRRLLEDALARLLSRQPYSRISVKEVAAEAGVNRATFYAHFVDKDDLFRGLLHSAFDRTLDAAPGDADAGDAAADGVAAYLDRLLPAVFAHADWLAGQCRRAGRDDSVPLPEVELQAQLMAHVLQRLQAAAQGEGRAVSEIAARAVSAMIVDVATDWSRRMERPPAEKVMVPLRAMIAAALAAADT